MATINKDIVYWLERIDAKLASINQTITPAEESLIVSGTVSEGAFTPAAGETSFEAALAAVVAGTPVFLCYEVEEADTYDFVVLASEASISTSNSVTWSAPVEETPGT